MKQFLLINLIFLITRIAYADANPAACDIYVAIQEGTTLQDIQNVIHSSSEPQTLQINQGYRWVFDNGDVAYVEFDNNGNLAGPKELHGGAEETSDAETEFNEDLSDHSLTLSQANNLLSPGELVEYDFVDTFNDGTTIKGFTDKNNRVLATSIHPACGDDTESHKSFRSTNDEPQNIYEETNADSNANPPSESQPVIIEEAVPLFLYSPIQNDFDKNNHQRFESNKQKAVIPVKQTNPSTTRFQTGSHAFPSHHPSAAALPVTPTESRKPTLPSQSHHH